MKVDILFVSVQDLWIISLTQCIIIHLHFLHSHLNFFPDNLGIGSDAKGERFHQDATPKKMGYSDDFCWSLQKEDTSLQ